MNGLSFLDLRTASRCASPRHDTGLGTGLERGVEGVVPALDRASHERSERRHEQSADLFDVREPDPAIADGLDLERARAGEEPARDQSGSPGCHFGCQAGTVGPHQEA
jgi:hypothetical protein